MATAVSVRGLVKSYAGRRVVDELSFDVPEGVVFGLLGPNGAGKTTTVECVEGFRRPDAGRVRVLGLEPRRDRPALAERMGVMLQEGGIWPAATPAETMRLFACLHRRTEDPDEFLERVGLHRRRTAPYRSLSGGEKRRLDLALALVGRPEVVVLDEPTAGMDPHARHVAWGLVRELRDRGTAVLLTTHAMDEAERLADRVGLVDGGRLLACDSPSALVADRAPSRLLVTALGPLDHRALATAVGASVRPDGEGRWLVDAGPDAIPRVSAWFDEQGLPLTGVSAVGGLEDVFFRLTGQGAAR
ncbi:MAG: ABC transporter ATP-binding protein [Actinomycetota bacterium]|nr:ABC transporter ATP-binding protein [Actinomycetota bacterium]